MIDAIVPAGAVPSTYWECGTVCGSLITIEDGTVIPESFGVGR